MAERPYQRALNDFLAEAQEVVETLDREILHLEDTRREEEADPEVVNVVFRAAHTLKGLCAMFGAERMAALAHALEDRLEGLRMGRRRFDRETLELLQATPSLFARMVAEEAAQSRTPAVGAEAEALAARLREPEGSAALTPEDPLLELDLQPGVRTVLTEYEEHRLRTRLRQGASLYRVRVRFPLATFDTGLDELKRRLQPVGEVVAALPSAEAADPDALGFDVLFGTSEPIEAVSLAAGPEALLEVVPRRPKGAQPSAPPAPPLRSAAPAPPPPPARAPRVAPRPPEPQPPVFSGAGARPEVSIRSVSLVVRVDIAKLDRLMNLVGELVLVKTSLLGIAQRLRSGDESTTLGLELHRESRALDRKLDELQGGILEVRMVPLEQVFDKLSRMARKLARDLGKQVELEVQGGQVELDKLIVEELSDPLMHLVRNALDHAIEPPELRLAAGKPSRGTVRLTAEQRGNHVVITVEDDGAGLDERVLGEAALRRGLVAPEALALMGRREVLNLVFVAGFSTKREVSSLSGRGVGMDVVKNNIAAMSGIIDLESELGVGTRFRITLPVTLAIVRALVVSVAGRTYAVPLNSVLEVVTLAANELRSLSGREVVSLRGSTLPLVRLGRLFAPGAPPPASGEPEYVVVVGLAQERLALAVDGLVGQQDIVVKPLGRALSGVRGIAGATDLGGRRTVLVLDIGAIIEEVLHAETRMELT